jgi:zinc protease
MRHRLLSLLLVVVFCGPVQAAEQTSRQVLDNGLTVLIAEMPSSPTVSVYALVKTGSATEGKFLGTGISHFLEHMLFKGTKKRSMGVISQEVKALGGTINASTSFDYTIYTLDVPKAAFAPALDIMADMLMNSVLDPVEVNKEREVIFGEMRMINDRPGRKLADIVFNNIYTRHPYRHPIIGYVPLFGKISPQDLADYYRSKYVPNNIVFSVAGAVKAGDVLPEIEKTFKTFEPKPYQDRNLSVEPPQNFSRRVEQEYPSDIYRFTMAYQGVSLFDRDMYAMDVLAMALGQGESSRLYLDVFKNRRLVDSISASDYTPVDRGTFEVTAETSKDTVEEAIAAIKQNIEAIKKNGIRPEELQKTKHQVMSSKVFGRQTAPSVAYQNAVNEAFVGDHKFEDRYLEEIKRITSDDIKRVANAYLVDQRLTIVILKPQNKGSQKAAADEQASNSIQKSVLPNGLTVLLKEDHTFPLVAVNVAINAGLRQEPVELNGLAYLTANLWSKGTKKWTAQQIAEMVEARGAGFSSFSGYNSMGLRVDALAEDLPFALDVIEASIKEPAFSVDEFNKQKQINIADIKQQEDSIFDVTMRHLLQTVFLTHPMRYEPLGTVGTVSRINREDVTGFYRRHVSPSNMVITVYGDIKPQEVLASLQKRFGDLPAGPVELSKFQEDIPKDMRVKDLVMDKEQAAFMAGFHAPSMFDGDRYGMEVISSIFGSSLSGRMFVKIREELGNAYAVGANYTPGKDAGMIYFYVLTTEAQLEKVKAILFKELQSLVNAPPGAEELKITKANLKGRFAMGLDTVGELASLTTFDELYGLGYANYQEYEKKIDAVTAQDIQRIARKYLDPARASVVVTRPPSK